jgi:hypothetical protein
VVIKCGKWKSQFEWGFNGVSIGFQWDPCAAMGFQWDLTGVLMRPNL